jgi:ketosteroid isomerase-like protein
MGEQENTAVARQAYENFRTGDTGALLGQMAEDIDWRLPDIAGVPFAGARRGTGQVAEFFSTLADVQDVLSFEPREFVAQGERVVALGDYRWRVRKNGREYGGGFAHVFTVRDGKVVAFHEYMDTAAAAEAFK